MIEPQSASCQLLNKKTNRALVFELAIVRWIIESDGAVLPGPSGTGKSYAPAAV